MSQFIELEPTETLKKMQRAIEIFTTISEAEKELNELGFNHKIVIHEPDAKI